VQRRRQGTAVAALAFDRQVAREAAGHLLSVAAEAVAHFEAAGIEPQGGQGDRQGVAADEWPAEIGLAVHDRQRHGRGAPGGREDLARGDAEALEALFIGLMAPPQQLVEVHYSGGVGVAEAHGAAEQQPGIGIHRRGRRRRGRGRRGGRSTLAQ
jgi:hypothetical protein